MGKFYWIVVEFCDEVGVLFDWCEDMIGLWIIVIWDWWFFVNGVVVWLIGVIWYEDLLWEGVVEICGMILYDMCDLVVLYVMLIWLVYYL